MDVLVVLCTVPNVESAERIALDLVSRQLAACVNRIAGVVSTYRWQDEIRVDDEVLLLIKTTSARFEALEARIVELHPYELPEVIAVKVESGLGRYLAWVAQETSPPA